MIGPGGSNNMGLGGTSQGPGQFSMGGMGPAGAPRMMGPMGPGVNRMPSMGMGSPGISIGQGGTSGPTPMPDSGCMMNTMTDGGQDQGGANPTPPPNTGKTTPTPGQPKEVNTSTVCRIGQETVEEIVSRTQEVFSILKSLQPPVGSFSAQTQQHDKATRCFERNWHAFQTSEGMLGQMSRKYWWDGFS